MYSLEKIKEFFQKELKEYNFKGKCPTLYAPVEYIQGLPSKKIRPILVMIGAQLCGGDIRKAIMPALGTELFHNFSLMHDDIMDKATLRRGHQSVHEKWSVNQAILSGDLMLLEAYKHIFMNVEEKIFRNVFNEFTHTSIEVCLGQQLDLDFETQPVVALDDYMEMIRLKTAVLLGFCLKLGSIIAGSNKNVSEKLYNIGETIGIAFQLKDDYLDVYGGKVVGKQNGGDIRMKKKTYLYIKALEQANSAQKSVLLNAMTVDYVSDDMIEEVTGIFSDLDVDKQALTVMNTYTLSAIKLCEQLDYSSALKQPLFDVIEKLKTRNS